MRYEAKKEHDAVKEAGETLKENQQILENTQANVSEKVAFDLVHEKNQISRQSRKFEEKYRKQAVQKEDELSLLKHQYQRA